SGRRFAQRTAFVGRTGIRYASDSGGRPPGEVAHLVSAVSRLVSPDVDRERPGLGRRAPRSPREEPDGGLAVAQAGHVALARNPFGKRAVGNQAPMTTSYSLTHLKQLEAESIHIIREVVAEFENPVMMYSIGKDSMVMLRLAIKAFHPAPLPFPLLHVDTTWKFRDMIAFRDATAKRLAARLIVHTNQEGVARGINPIISGSSIHTHVMKTEALKAALDLHGFDAAFGGARRDEEKSRAKERIFSFRSKGHAWDPQ